MVAHPRTVHGRRCLISVIRQVLVFNGERTLASAELMRWKGTRTKASRASFSITLKLSINLKVQNLLTITWMKMFQSARINYDVTSWHTNRPLRHGQDVCSFLQLQLGVVKCQRGHSALSRIASAMIPKSWAWSWLISTLWLVYSKGVVYISTWNVQSPVNVVLFSSRKTSVFWCLELVLVMSRKSFHSIFSNNLQTILKNLKMSHLYDSTFSSSLKIP